MSQVFRRLIEKSISLPNTFALHICNIRPLFASEKRGWRERLFGNRSQRLFVLPVPILGAFVVGLCLSLVFATCTANNAANPNAISGNNSTPGKASVVRLGYQKGTPFLNILKGKGNLEKRLGSSGVAVKCVQYDRFSTAVGESLRRVILNAVNRSYYCIIVLAAIACTWWQYKGSKRVRTLPYG